MPFPPSIPRSSLEKPFRKKSFTNGQLLVPLFCGQKAEETNHHLLQELL
jgi:hypothetical protein